jgi:hypothetical protein
MRETGRDVHFIIRRPVVQAPRAFRALHARAAEKATEIWQKDRTELVA